MRYTIKKIFLSAVCLIPLLIAIGLMVILKLNSSFITYIPSYFLSSMVIVQVIIIWIYGRYKESNALYTISIKNLTKLCEGKITLDNAPGKSKNTNDYNLLKNKIVKYYSKLHEVALNISLGKLDISYQAETSEDVLGNTLVDLRDKLIKISEGDKARAWSSNGLAEFVTLLREESNIRKLCDAVLAFIIKYINANQGSIYLHEKNDRLEDVLVTAAIYAYERKKHLTQEIYPGHGLVGQCYYEKEIIYLTEVPSDYIKITSGLGEA